MAQYYYCATLSGAQWFSTPLRVSLRGDGHGCLPLLVRFVIAPTLLALLNVGVLALLGVTAEQDDQHVALLPDIDAIFGHALADISAYVDEALYGIRTVQPFYHEAIDSARYQQRVP